MTAEIIRQAVQAILPSLTDEKLTEVCERIEEVGVESVADLQYCTEDDLITVLQPIQIRRMLTAWKEKGRFFSMTKLLGLENISLIWKSFGS